FRIWWTGPGESSDNLILCGSEKYLKFHSRRTGMSSEDQNEAMNPNSGNSIGRNNRGRRLIIYAVLLLVVFLAGLVPMWLKSRTQARERDAAQASLRISNLENLLGNAAIDARRAEYEPARQAVSDFFTNLQIELDRGRDSAFNEGQRNA